MARLFYPFVAGQWRCSWSGLSLSTVGDQLYSVALVPPPHFLSF